ncbi:MAG: T9SS type A sorting domain-containing protein [Burkholderiales bacterium]|nr:T9SS type A sorting domain-containing protein [Bacteroidia bacterium]
MKSFICIIVTVLFFNLQSLSQQIVFNPLVNCGSDTSFLSGNTQNYFHSSDIHIDKRGNYHLAGFSSGYNYPSQSVMLYRKYNKQKLPIYSRSYVKPSIGEINGGNEYLNSVTTDDSLNYYYTGQFMGKGNFIFDNLYYIWGSSSNIYDFAFITKHDSLNNLKNLTIFAPNYASNSSNNGFCAFTDIVYLNGKIYTILNTALPGFLKTCNISNNSWTNVGSLITPGMYLLEYNLSGNLINKILITDSYNSMPNIFYYGSGAYSHFNSKAASLVIDKQNRLLIHYLNQTRPGEYLNAPITFGPNVLMPANMPLNMLYPKGVSTMAIYDPVHGWINGKVIEKGNLSNITGCITNSGSDIHGNKYFLGNNISSTSFTNNISIINNDSLNSLGASISKIDVNGNFVWNKYFFNCSIVDMKLSPDEKHIGVVVNPNASYTTYIYFGNKFSFGNSQTNLDTVYTPSGGSVFLQFSNNGVLEKSYNFTSLNLGLFLNIDDNGYFNLNGIKVPQAPSYNTRTTSIKIDGNTGQCTGPAFPGGLNDTLFIHLPKKELCSNTSLYIPWISTPSIPTINLGYYINGSTTKNFIASNIAAQTYGYQWNMPNVILGADSIKLFIESSDLLFSHQIGFYKFRSNKNILTSRDTTICKNIPLVLAPINPSNLIWSPASYFTNPQLDTTQVVGITNATQLFVKETYTNSVCFSYDTINVQVFLDPVAAFSHSLLPTSLSLLNNSINSDSIKWIVNNVMATTYPNNLVTGFTSPTMTVCLLASKCITDTICQIINVRYAVNDSLEICALDSAFLQGNWQFSPGIYTDTLTATFNIDSIVKTTLIVHPVKSRHTVFSVCSNDSIFFNGQYHHNNYVFSDTLVTSYGCDSIVKTTINFKPVYFTATNMFICAYDSVFLEGQYRDQPGFFRDTLQSIYGCDSIVHTQLNINITDIGTTLNGAAIMANAVNATYQWINCSNNFPLVNGTSQVYNPTNNGSYACIVNQFNCIDTTACVTVMSVGLTNTLKEKDVIYYPNPTNGIFTIELEETATLDIFNVFSELIYNENLKQISNRIDLTNLPDGIYFIKVTLDKQVKNAVIIKK